MMLGEKDLPVSSRFAVNLPRMSEGVHLRLATTVGVNPSVHRIGQHEIDHMVARLLPADDSSHSSHQSLRGQFETLPCQVRENPADRAELPEEAKDEFDGVSHTLICLQPDLTTENIILQTDRHIPDQSAALGFIESASHHTCFDLVELYLRNGSLQRKARSLSLNSAGL